MHGKPLATMELMKGQRLGKSDLCSGSALRLPGHRRWWGSRVQSLGVIALLFDHMLVDHRGDEGQCDDVSSCGQNLCNHFVLKRKKGTGQFGNQGQHCCPTGSAAWLLLEAAQDPRHLRWGYC